MLPIRLVVVVGLLGVLGGCSEGPEDAHEYYFRAVDLFERQQTDLAEVELRRALHLKPDYLNALKLQVRVDETQRDLAGVVRSLDAIIDLEPENTSAHRRKAEILLLGKDVEEAQTHIYTALSLNSDNAEVQNLLIASMMQSGNVDEAASRATDLLDSGAGNASSYAMGVASLIQLEQLARARVYLNQGVERYPDDPILLLLRSRLAQALGQLSEAPVIYEKVLELHPNEISIWWEFARFYVRTQEEAEAVQVMQRAVDANPGSESAQYLLAQIMANTGQSDLFAQLEGLLADRPSDNVRLLLATLYRDADQFADAESHYRTLLSQSSTDSARMTARVQLAQIALNNGDRDRALDLLEDVLSQDSKHPGGQLTLAMMELRDRKAESAILRLNELLRNDPSQDDGYALLGRAYAAGGNTQRAMEAFKSSLSINPLNSVAGRNLALLQRLNDEPEKVIETLRPFMEADVADLPIQRELLRAYLAAEQWQQARAMVRSERSLVGNSVSSAVVDAIVLQQSGQPLAAVALLEPLLEAHPDIRDIAVSLNAAYRAAQLLLPAVRTFGEYASKYPEHSWFEELYIKLLVDSGEYEQAERLLVGILEQQRAQVDHYGWLALLCLRQSDSAGAVRWLERGVQQYPDSAGLLEDLAVLQESTGRIAASLANYERVLELEPDRALAANNLAMRYALDAETLPRARALAQILDPSDDPYYADTLGWVCLKTGELECALTNLELAAQALPESAETAYHLAMAYRANNQQARSAEMFRRSQDLLRNGSTPFPGSETIDELLAEHLSS